MLADHGRLGILSFGTQRVAMTVSLAVLSMAVFGVCLLVFAVISSMVISSMPPMTGGIHLNSRGIEFWDKTLPPMTGGMWLINRGTVFWDMVMMPPMTGGPTSAHEMVMYVFRVPNRWNLEAVHRVFMYGL